MYVATKFPDKHTIYYSLFHEPALALLVALTTWWGFELWRKIDDQREWEERLRNVQENVFFGVLRRHIPQDMLYETNRLILASKFIRDDVRVVWDLKDHEVDDGIGGKMPCVLVDAEVTYKVINVSEESEPYDLCMLLPNPRDRRLRKACELNMIGYVDEEDGEEKPVNLSHTIHDPHYCVETKEEPYLRCSAGEVTILPGHSITFFARFKMAKKLEDSEFHQSILPATSMTVTVADHTSDPNRQVFARAIHSKGLVRKPEVPASPAPAQSRTYVFTLRGCVLPHQGLMIWWESLVPALRIVPDDMVPALKFDKAIPTVDEALIVKETLPAPEPLGSVSE